MNVQQKGFVTLIKSALHKCAYTLPEGFCMEQAAQEAMRHKVVGLMYYGAVLCGVDKKSEPMQKLFRYLIPTMNICEKQRFELDRVFGAFRENGIDFMPVKGVVLQKYFPAMEMRTMGDADILIRMEQYAQIEQIMLRLGFEFAYESDHELVWRNKNLFLELHKRLIPSYNHHYAAYYGDGWRLAKGCEDHCYFMNDEDQMIYLFTHFAKHYRDGGIGIRHLVDLYVFENAKQLDHGYMTEELKKLKLLEFYNNVTDTLAAWFNDAPQTEITALITDVIFGSGPFGTEEDKIAAGGLREMSDGKTAKKMRHKRIRNVIFLPYEYMCETYPVLKKWKILLPVMWIVRGVKVLLFKRDQLKQTHKNIKLLSDDRIDTYERSLRTVGLSFEFKE